MKQPISEQELCKIRAKAVEIKTSEKPNWKKRYPKIPIKGEHPKVRLPPGRTKGGKKVSMNSFK